jgi:Ca-activated chloride channel family protein
VTLAALAVALGLAFTLPASAYKRAEKKRIEAAALSPEHLQWLMAAEFIISEEEFEGFLALTKDYQRDAFIDRFWKERDPYPETARNEFKRNYEERMAFILERYGQIDSDPGRMLLLNGMPNFLLEVDCPIRLHPMEVWFYDGSAQVGFQFYLVFYKREGVGPYRLWYPSDGLDALFDDMFAGGGNSRAGSLEQVRMTCREGDVIAKGISWVLAQGIDGFGMIRARLESKPDPPQGEWVATFAAYSTDLDADEGVFAAELDVAYPGRKQSRTVMQGILKVATDQAETVTLSGLESYNFLLNGEILREGELFEAFRYKFDFPVGTIRDGMMPMVFQRTMRPGDYKLVVKLEDLNGGRAFRTERELTVPKLDNELPAPPPDDPISARLLAEANAAIRSDDTTLKLVRPLGELHSGLLRVETLMTGDGIHKATFFLDGRAVLTKRRPPFSVEVDLGDLPRTRNLRVVGYDPEGEEIVSDEMMLNANSHRFAARLVEPRRGKNYQQSLQAEAEISVPEDQTLERVEFFLNETLVATLYQPPYTQPIVLPPGGAVAYVRTVAYLKDGNSTEDLVFVNAPEYLEEVDVQLVELYTSVLNREGRPVKGLNQEQFSVSEDGVPQEIVRFDQVEDRAIHTGILLDVSASMDDSMGAVQEAALQFFETAIEPRDRAALVTFNDRPNLAVKFTNEVQTLSGGLAGLKAERGTALYDSVIFGLYYFNGIRGQKALLVLSDGKDESSRFGFEETLEFAQRAGVTIYAIGLKEAAKDRDARKKLSQLADTTGGRSFFIEGAGELASVYQQIQDELRSQYLIVYQSNNTSGDTDFRSVTLKVDDRSLEVKTLSGYYP